MSGYDVDGISVWSVVVAEPPRIRQHFFQFVGVIALGFYWVRKRLASFFSVFSTRRRADYTKVLPVEEGKGSDANRDSRYYLYAAE